MFVEAEGVVVLPVEAVVGCGDRDVGDRDAAVVLVDEHAAISPTLSARSIHQ